MRSFLTILFLFAGTAIFARQSPIDSMLNALKTSRDDSTKTKAYYNIAQKFIDTDPVKATLYADSGLAHAKRINWPKGIAFMYLTKGNILNVQGNEAAIDLYKQALNISKSIKDNTGIARAMNDIGGVYFRKSDFTSAVEWYEKAQQLGEADHDDNILGTTYTNYSSVYFAQKNYPKAIDYAQRSLQHFEKLSDQDKIARSLNYIGNVYLQEGNIPKTEEYYTRALKIYERVNNRTGMAILYSQIAILYEPDYEKIISYQQRSQDIWDEINPTHYNSIINLGNMGETYLNMIRVDSAHRLSSPAKNAILQKAEEHLQRAIKYAKQTNDADNLSYFSGILAEEQELKGDYRSAIGNYKLSWYLQDSLFSQTNKNKIAAIESQRQIDVRDKQLQINQLTITNQKKQRIAMIAGLLLLIAIGTLLYYQSRTRKKTNTKLLRLNNELDEANKLKAKFFAILSHDLRSPISNLVSFLEIQQEAPGTISAEAASVHQEKIKRSAGELLDTMESMLIWSKGQMENFRPQPTQVAVSFLFDHIKKIFANSNVPVTFIDPGNMMIRTDEHYVKTIMHNLTSNALKAVQGVTGAEVEWKTGKENGRPYLVLYDNGPGISRDQSDILFDAGEVTANVRNGFGLHLIRDLAKAIDCKIIVQASEEEGTTFVLMFNI